MRTNDEIIDLLENLKEEKNLSISEIARRVNIAKSSVSRYFNRTREFPLNRVDDFAKAFNVESEYILGIDFKAPTNMIFPERIVNIPIIGTIAAGLPITAEQNISEYIPVIESTLPTGQIIGLNIRGDSMSPGIPDHSQVMIRLQPDVEDGEIAAVLVNGDTEATLKRIKRQGDILMLIPDNTKYQPIIITKDSPAKIIGKAVQVVYNL
jgi:repressor LexA